MYLVSHHNQSFFELFLSSGAKLYDTFCLPILRSALKYIRKTLASMNVKNRNQNDFLVYHKKARRRRRSVRHFLKKLHLTYPPLVFSENRLEGGGKLAEIPLISRR